MGNKFSNNGNGRKQSNGGKHFVAGYSDWTSNIIAEGPGSKIERMKQIADISFHILGAGYIAADVIAKMNGFLNTVILLILTVYFGFRSYFRLRREQIALKKEMFEQMQREKEFYKT